MKLLGVVLVCPPALDAKRADAYISANRACETVFCTRRGDVTRRSVMGRRCGNGRPKSWMGWPSKVAFFSFNTSLNGDENANEDFDYYWYVACCCLHKPDGDGRRAQPPEGDPRTSSRNSTASESALVRGRRVKECPRRRPATTDPVTYSGATMTDRVAGSGYLCSPGGS